MKTTQGKKYLFGFSYFDLDVCSSLSNENMKEIMFNYMQLNRFECDFTRSLQPMIHLTLTTPISVLCHLRTCSTDVVQFTVKWQGPLPLRTSLPMFSRSQPCLDSAASPFPFLMLRSPLEFWNNLMQCVGTRNNVVASIHLKMWHRIVPLVYFIYNYKNINIQYYLWCRQETNWPLLIIKLIASIVIIHQSELVIL